MDSTRLAAIPLFAALEPDQLDAVAAVATEVSAEPGQALATQGDFGHALYAIEDGTADVSRGGEQIRSLGPGDVFGEVAVLKAGRRTATVTASSKMQLIALFKRDVWTLERDCPEAGERLRQLVAERLGTPEPEPQTS
jgi:CRP-like cAMP-binding protein